MASKADITLRLAAGFTPDQARDARARALAFVFRCYESKKNPAAGQGRRGDSDGTETEEDSANAPIIFN